VLLQHGLGTNMMQWIMHYPDKAHAWVLANMGYDVWMGNNRGTYFSLGHDKYDHKKDRAYWDFSWEQMGLYDVPANI
jgi:hypothetical protein